MATYTGVADANGDFNIPFSANYTGGQKVTVTSEKYAATKSIELYAPSEVVGGEIFLSFSGNLLDFPRNIGTITFSAELSGVLNPNALAASSAKNYNIWRMATGLVFLGDITQIGDSALANWSSIQVFVAPLSLVSVLSMGMAGWSSCLSAEFGENLSMLGATALTGWTSCNELIFRSVTPPTIASSTFSNLKSTCVFKVPAGSVAAYQAAPNWSAFAARIQAI